LDYGCAGLCGLVVAQSAKPALDSGLAAWAPRCNELPCGSCPVQSVAVRCAQGTCMCAEGGCQ
jgi:hypothetical protein